MLHRYNNEGMEVVDSESDSPPVDGELNGDENMNQADGGLVMPARKRKKPSPIWQFAGVIAYLIHTICIAQTLASSSSAC